VEYAIERQGFDHPEFAKAVKITDELMGKVRAKVGSIPIYAFNCSTSEPYDTAFEQIAANHGVQYWKDIAEVVQRAKADGLDVRASDAHWNELGHAMVADALARHFQERLWPTRNAAAH
jgi:hypothetical protein